MTETTPPSADPTPGASGVSAGWYPDPGSSKPRWWDGRAWTETFATTVGAPKPGTKPTNWFARLSLVASLGSVIGLFTDLPWLTLGGIAVGVIAGIAGVQRANRGAEGKSIAVWGIVLGGLVLTILIFAYLAVYGRTP